MNAKELQNQISQISRKAKSFSLKSDYLSAIKEYLKALALLDEPKTSSEFAVMLFAGIGEAYFLQSIWEQSYEYFSKALKSKGGSSDPYLNLRMGQILFEQGDLKKSEKALLKAYKGSGHFIFDGEDKKYFELIREIVG